MKPILWVLMLSVSWPLLAQEPHHLHGAATPSEAVTVGEGALAPTGEGVSGAQRCALARRGVVMLDNASWVACGDKPPGVPVSVLPVAEETAPEHHGHGGH